MTSDSSTAAGGLRRGLLILLAAALIGGLRQPIHFAFGGVAVGALLWLETPPLGPAAAWLPWLGWSFVCAMLGGQPASSSVPLARSIASLGVLSLAGTISGKERREWASFCVFSSVVAGAAGLITGAGGGFRAAMTGLLPPYYNYTAFAVGAGASVGFALALHARATKMQRAAGGLAAAFGAFCVFLARSRGAALGLVAAAAVWSVRRWGRRAAAAWLVLALVGGAVFGAGMLPPALKAAVAKRGRRYEEARLQIWRAAVAIASERPFLGVGPGSFDAAFARRPVEAKGGAARWGMGTPFAHSEPLQAAAETGWFGFALWLIGFGMTLSALLGRASEEPAREAAVAALAAMAVQLLVDNVLQIPGLAFLFFSAAAVAGAPSWSARRWPRWAIVLGAGLAPAAWVPRALADRDPARAAVLFPAEAGPREDLAYRALSAGRLDEADARWAEAAERAPFDAVYPWRRAQIASARERWAEAESFAKAALDLEPGFLSARVLRAEALARLRRPAAARAELAETLRLKDADKDLPPSSGYDKTIAAFDAAEFARVIALVERSGAR